MPRDGRKRPMPLALLSQESLNFSPETRASPRECGRKYTIFESPFAKKRTENFGPTRQIARAPPVLPRFRDPEPASESFEDRVTTLGGLRDVVVIGSHELRLRRECERLELPADLTLVNSKCFTGTVNGAPTLYIRLQPGEFSARGWRYTDGVYILE